MQDMLSGRLILIKENNFLAADFIQEDLSELAALAGLDLESFYNELSGLARHLKWEKLSSIFSLKNSFFDAQVCILKEGLEADVFILLKLDSTFDFAWQLNANLELKAWSAVIALTQDKGRGQLRRQWLSPVGNLYVTFMLPQADIFKTDAAALLTAYLILEAFKGLGLNLQLKWPNDLVLNTSAEGQTDKFYAKLGGILLEERHDTILAGLGLNCLFSPPAAKLKEDFALPATHLPDFFNIKSPILLWLKLVEKMKMSYKKMFSANNLQELLGKAEDYLLWNGEEIYIYEHSFADYANSSEKLEGVLLGLTKRGALRVLTPFLADGSTKELEISSGSIRAKKIS